MFSAASGSLRLPPLLTKAAKSCSVNTTKQVKHYPEKRGIVHNEILLPANAPPEYADRNTLWNAAEAVEKQWNSQLARRWVLTIPREIPPDQYAALVREFCNQQFVSKGMIAWILPSMTKGTETHTPMSC